MVNSRSRDVINDLQVFLGDGRYGHFVDTLWSRWGPDMGGIPLWDGQSLSVEALCGIREQTDQGAALLRLGAELWSHEGGELQAIEVFRVAAQQGSPEAVAAAGESLHWMGDDERARGYLELAVQNDATRTPWLEGLLGETLLKVSDPATAREFLRSAYVAHDEFGLPLAVSLQDDGDTDDARRILEHLMTIGVYGAAIRLGNLHDEHGNSDAAIAAYQRGIESGDGHAAYNLGLLYFARHDTEAAARAFVQAKALGDMTEPPTPLDGRSSE